MNLSTLYSALIESAKAGEPLLTVRELTALLYLNLHQRTGRRTGEIADALHICKGAATRAITALESKGYVSNKRDTDDFRRNFVTLTASGRAYLERLELRLAPAKKKEAA